MWLALVLLMQSLGSSFCSARLSLQAVLHLWDICAWSTGSRIIATVFLSIYSMGADTILQCFLLDEELNKGSGGANARPPAMKGLVKELKRK